MDRISEKGSVMAAQTSHTQAARRAGGSVVAENSVSGITLTWVQITS